MTFIIAWPIILSQVWYGSCRLTWQLTSYQVRLDAVLSKHLVATQSCSLSPVFARSCVQRCLCCCKEMQMPGIVVWLELHHGLVETAVTVHHLIFYHISRCFVYSARLYVSQSEECQDLKLLGIFQLWQLSSCFCRSILGTRMALFQSPLQIALGDENDGYCV